MDVVVPFLGSPEQLAALAERLSHLALAHGDTLTIVDNSRGARMSAPAGMRILAAPELRTPGHARNRGAAAGRAEWLAFFDADTEPAPDLLARLFDPPPAERTGMLGGGVLDQPVPRRGGAVARYSHLRGAMSQDDTFRFGRWGYPKSANMAVRRSAFEAIGGFRGDMRAGEDADITYRLRAAGWEVERRESALVVHIGRSSVRSFAHQKLVHGAGGAWLEREHPGSFPARRRPGLIWWAARTALSGMIRALRHRDRDRALAALLEPLEHLAFEFGRSLPNERPLTLRVWLLTLARLIPPRGTPRI